MKAVIQRVRSASVEVAGECKGRIGHGLLILLGIAPGDSASDVEYLAGKCARLRIFEDEDGKMNRSVQDVGGACLVVSQFTLYGDSRKGNRPSFIGAADPEEAILLYKNFIEQLRGQNLMVETGEFGAMMEIALVNSGPVTMIVESKG